MAKKWPFGLAVTLGVWAMLMGTFRLQDRLLYFPEQASIETLVSDRLRAWPTARDFRGLVAEPPGHPRGTALIFHGNAGHVGHREYYVDPLTRLGFRVILAEYPGYGPRQGPLGEASLVADAENSIARAHRIYGAPLLVMGESLGAGVAAAASVRQGGKIAGMVLMTPWDRLADLASYHYPWLPVNLFLHDRYDNVTNLAGFSRPVAVVLAERDSIVPVRFGQRLYESLSAPKRLKIVRGADHNDWSLRVDSKGWREIIEFLTSSHGNEVKPMPLPE